MSQRWRSVGNTVCDLTGPRFEPQTSRSRDERLNTRPTGRYFEFCYSRKQYCTSALIFITVRHCFAFLVFYCCYSVLIADKWLHLFASLVLKLPDFATVQTSHCVHRVDWFIILCKYCMVFCEWIQFQCLVAYNTNKSFNTSFMPGIQVYFGNFNS